MALNQQEETSVPQQGLIIDEMPTVTPHSPTTDIKQETTTEADQENPALPPYQQNAPLAIDVSSGPAMVTPAKLLQRTPAWIDCAFCKRMTKTRVVMKEEKDEPSGLMICMVCLVCFPLLLCLPFMTGSKKTWTHVCTSCNAVIAVRGEQGQIEVKEPMPSNLVPSRFGAANFAPMLQAVPPAKTA